MSIYTLDLRRNARVEVLDLQDSQFKVCLDELSTSPSGSPYFLRCYESLCRKLNNEGCKNAVLLCIYIFNDSVRDVYVGGYLLGETNISRSIITGDIYFLYVHNMYRGHGHATTLYEYFERVVLARSDSLGVKSATVRVSMKECIRNSFKFWKNLKFQGYDDSICLIKQIKV